MSFRSQKPGSKSGDGMETLILNNIESAGWHINSVFGDPLPIFAYTVGLEHSFEHPELIVMGLPPNLAATLLNQIGESVREGRQFRDGVLLPGAEIGLEGDFGLGGVGKDAKEELMLSARWFYRGSHFRALQVIWQDLEKRFPGDPAFDTRLLRLQPLLR